MVIDAQQHFWQYDPMDFGWVSDDMRVLRQDFLPSDLRREMMLCGVDGVVAVAALHKRRENDWLLEQADAYDFVWGVVGWLPLNDFYIDDLLETYAADKRFVGIVATMDTEISPFAMRDAKFNEGVDALLKYNLALDMVIQERQLQEFVALVDRHPNQRFVLAHLGRPRVRDGAMLPWRENIKALARRPNVWCKLSGLATLANQKSWTDASLRPYFDVVVDAFGPSRLMFGSDWPICLTACKYARWHEIITKFVASLSAEEQALVMGGTTVAAYSLPVPEVHAAAAVAGRAAGATAAESAPVVVSNTMRALQFESAGTCGVATLPKPQPAAGEVLLRVRSAVLLLPDVEACLGQVPGVVFPVVPGHALAATVVDAASDVPDRLTVGLRVTVYPYVACGTCATCQRGRPRACGALTTMGLNAPGTLAEYLAVPWQQVIAAPYLEAAQLCLVAPLAEGFHAADLARVESMETVMVIGCDLVGLGVVAGAASRGAKVIAVDDNPSRLEFAGRLGALCRLNPTEVDLREKVRSATDARGPDVAVIVHGGAAALRLAVEELAYGGRLVSVDAGAGEVTLPGLPLVQKELAVCGSCRASEKDFEKVCLFLRKGTFPTDDVLASRTTLERVTEALEAWTQNPDASLALLVEMPA